MPGNGLSWVNEPCICNGTRFDTVELMIEEHELDRPRALAAFALGMEEYEERDGFCIEFRLEDPGLESDRVRRTRNFLFPGWRQAPHGKRG